MPVCPVREIEHDQTTRLAAALAGRVGQRHAPQFGPRGDGVEPLDHLGQRRPAVEHLALQPSVALDLHVPRHPERADLATPDDRGHRQLVGNTAFSVIATAATDGVVDDPAAADAEGDGMLRPAALAAVPFA